MNRELAIELEPRGFVRLYLAWKMFCASLGAWVCGTMTLHFNLGEGHDHER